MKVILTMAEAEVKKASRFLKIVHKNPSVSFTGMVDATVNVENEHDAAALYVAGKEISHTPKRA